MLPGGPFHRCRGCGKLVHRGSRSEFAAHLKQCVPAAILDVAEGRVLASALDAHTLSALSTLGATIENLRRRIRELQDSNDALRQRERDLLDAADVDRMRVSELEVEAEKAVSPSQPVTVLTEAAAVVDGPRRDAYGSPLENHGRTAALWSAYLGVAITARQVCMLNVLQKVSRDAHAAKRDNLVDIAGYVRNVELIDEAIDEGKPVDTQEDGA